MHVNSYRLLTGLDEKALRQACWRLGRKGLLTHVGGGWYTHAFRQARLEEVAAVLVRPSYVSLESALVAAGVTTQPSAPLTCITTAAAQTRRTPLGEIHYHSIKPDLFWGFERRQTLLEAFPEKALLDLIYLARKSGDRVWLDIDPARLNAARLREFAARFPATVRQQAQCYS